MKYRILYFIVLTSIFKSCIMLSCYGCFSCNYILDYITVFECEPGESCVTIVMAGLTFQDGYTTTVHRQCQGGYRLSNGTELGLVDWDYWVQSFCSSHNQDIAHLDTCLAIHCDTDLCNSLPVESLAVTKAAPSTYSSGGIEGNYCINLFGSLILFRHVQLIIVCICLQ